MSTETMEWLRSNILVGNTSKGILPWWSEDGKEDTLYAGPVPKEEVERRLLDWEVEESYMYDADMRLVEGWKMLRASDTKDLLYVQRESYPVHDYKTLLRAGNSLPIQSAGLLKNRNQFWVQWEKPKAAMEHCPEGVDFMPRILASTSLDSSIGTSVNDCVQLAVCDNTMNIARVQGWRHTIGTAKTWHVEVADAIEHLAGIANAFRAEVKKLCEIGVHPEEWNRYLDLAHPLPEKQTTKGGGPGRGYTMAENRREFMNELWHSDARVSPWKGTAFGVVQAENTYAHHNQIVRGATRAERQYERSISNDWAKVRESTLERLNVILERDELVSV